MGPFWFLIVSGNQVFDHVVSIEKEVGFVCAYATDPYKLTIRDGFFLMVWVVRVVVEILESVGGLTM